MVWKKFESKLEVVTKFIAIFVGISYALGFIIWNIYLQTLGFYPDLLQGRFILTGMLFFVLGISIVSALLFFKESLEKALPSAFSNLTIVKMNKENFDAWKFSFYTTIFIISIFLFSFFIFPKIPGYLGGGQPKFISIIGEEQNIAYLENFGIASASKIQTVLMCSAYEDSDYIVIILADRILSLKKDIYLGFGSLPSVDVDEYVNQCNMVITENLMGLRKLNTQTPPSK